MLAESNSDWVLVAQTIMGAIVTLSMPWVIYMIHKLEKNTNGIRDALVKTTAESEHAKGKLEGANEQKAETALKAEGAKELKETKL